MWIKFTRKLLAVLQILGVSKPESVKRFQETQSWAHRRYAPPSPNFVKRSVIIRNGLKNSTWIETGTYLGGTTKILGKHGRHVISIEPDILLFKRAQKRLKSMENITLLNGLSEDVLPAILSELEGNVCFWLDGHFSSGITFNGPRETPILDELSSIEKNLAHFDQVVILVDDVRLFESSSSQSDYPSLDVLVDWARSNNLQWRIEHDIFVFTNF